MFAPRTVYGVDFSGARLAGEHTWLARLEPAGKAEEPPPPVTAYAPRGSGASVVGERSTVYRTAASEPEPPPPPPAASPAYRLTQLAPLGSLARTDQREPALRHLVARIAASEDALWAIDFPFGLPVEVMPPGAGWRAQLAFVRTYAPEECWAAGVECLDRAKALGREGHIRRLTDAETRAPWDSYHYRIIYQTFFGMRDVLVPLLRVPGTAVLPFHYWRLPTARRAVVEACPASTLKRLGLPHQNFKEPGGGSPSPRRRRVRREILEGLGAYVSVGRVRRRILMNDGGGDALDALIAAVGAALSWRETDHRAVMRHPRYVREGRHYV